MATQEQTYRPGGDSNRNVPRLSVEALDQLRLCKTSVLSSAQGRVQIDSRSSLPSHLRMRNAQCAINSRPGSAHRLHPKRLSSVHQAIHAVGDDAAGASPSSLLVAPSPGTSPCIAAQLSVSAGGLTRPMGREIRCRAQAPRQRVLD